MFIDDFSLFKNSLFYPAGSRIRPQKGPKTIGPQAMFYGGRARVAQEMNHSNATYIVKSVRSETTVFYVVCAWSCVKIAMLLACLLVWLAAPRGSIHLLAPSSLISNTVCRPLL